MNNNRYKILLVDDENDILEFLSYNLKKEGFEVYTASNGLKAIEIAKKTKPQLILLDVMMPEMDGMETCEIIRKDNDIKHTIIAFLTARGEDYSQIAGFDAGADDYIKKPVKPKVLISRIKALLKRTDKYAQQNEPQELITIGDLSIDLEKHKVLKNNTEIKLPRKEFKLLVLLAKKADHVFTRDDIFSKVWGDNIIVGDRTIDVHIRKLREKIGDKHIETIKGIGYKFVE